MQTKSKPKMAQPVVGADLVPRRLNSSIGGAPRRPVVKANAGVLPPNALHAQAGFARSAPLSSWGIKALGGIKR